MTIRHGGVSRRLHDRRAGFAKRLPAIRRTANHLLGFLERDQPVRQRPRWPCRRSRRTNLVRVSPVSVLVGPAGDRADETSYWSLPYGSLLSTNVVRVSSPP